MISAELSVAALTGLSPVLFHEITLLTLRVVIRLVTFIILEVSAIIIIVLIATAFGVALLGALVPPVLLSILVSSTRAVILLSLVTKSLISSLVTFLVVKVSTLYSLTILPLTSSIWRLPIAVRAALIAVVALTLWHVGGIWLLLEVSILGLRSIFVFLCVMLVLILRMAVVALFVVPFILKRVGTLHG